MTKILISWMGNADIEASEDKSTSNRGALGRLLESRKFDKVVVLYNDKYVDKVTAYSAWLEKQVSLAIEYKHVPLAKGPVNHEGIYEAVLPVVQALKEEYLDSLQLTYFLTPGTKSMVSIWMLLGKSIFPGRFIQTSREEGIEDVDIPFDLAVDYIPEFQRKIDEEINKRASGELPANPAFENIIARSKVMREAIGMAEKVAPRSVTVLLEGNPGAGKEIFAKAIHDASGRDKLIKVDCGCPPKNMFSKEFNSKAAGGTLYLARLNELSDNMQVKLLDQFSKLSTSENIRIIVGTDIELRDQIRTGTFRQELYYLLAAAIIKLPDIRRRGADLSLLVTHFFDKLNAETAAFTSKEQKTLSAAAKRALLEHPWPGNVTELVNTLQRVILWTSTKTIKEEDMKNAILDPVEKATLETILDRDLADGIDLPAIIEEVKKHYLVRGWKESGHSKTRLSEILGLPSYQLASNWLKKHKIA